MLLCGGATLSLGLAFGVLHVTVHAMAAADVPGKVQRRALRSR